MCTRHRKRWTDQDTTLLIELYATYGVSLWNTFMSSRDENAKITAMQQICAEMKMKGYEEHEVKQKLKYILKCYKEERLKISEDRSYHPAGKWFKKVDSFLRQHVNLSDIKQAPKNDVPSSTAQHSASKRKLPPEPPKTPETPKRAVKDTTTSDSKNPFDIFGKSIAAQLKVLPKRVAVETQFRIQAMLTDQTLILEDLGNDETGNATFNIPPNVNFY